MPFENKNIDLLLTHFSSVYQIGINLNQSRYYRSLDRLIIPEVQYTKEFYFTIAHELGHKYNNRLLLAFFKILPIKVIQILLEIDANEKGSKFIEPELLNEYNEFVKYNLTLYMA